MWILIKKIDITEFWIDPGGKGVNINLTHSSVNTVDPLDMSGHHFYTSFLWLSHLLYNMHVVFLLSKKSPEDLLFFLTFLLCLSGIVVLKAVAWGASSTFSTPSTNLSLVGRLLKSCCLDSPGFWTEWISVSRSVRRSWKTLWSTVGACTNLWLWW